MMTNVYEYDDINRLAFHIIMLSQILSSLSGNCANSFLLKVSCFRQMFRSKSKNAHLSKNCIYTQYNFPHLSTYPGICNSCGNKQILLDFLVTVKAAPHECVIRTGQSET